MHIFYRRSRDCDGQISPRRDSRDPEPMSPERMIDPAKTTQPHSPQPEEIERLIVRTKTRFDQAGQLEKAGRIKDAWASYRNGTDLIKKCLAQTSSDSMRQMATRCLDHVERFMVRPCAWQATRSQIQRMC